MSHVKSNERKLVDQYDWNLMELESIATKDFNLEEMVKFYDDSEKQIRTLVSKGTWIPTSCRNLLILEEYRQLIGITSSFTELLDILEVSTTLFESDIIQHEVVTHEFYKLYTNEYLGISLKRKFSKQMYAIENKALESQKLRLLIQYENKLMEIESMRKKDLVLEEMEEFCRNFETIMYNLDSEEASILLKEIRGFLKYRFQVNLKKYRIFIKRIYHFYHLLEFISAPVFEDDPQFKTLLFRAEQELIKLLTNAYLGKSLNLTLSTEYKTRIELLTFEVIERLLPIEYKHSIYYMEKTLAEREFYTLPRLILWRETAEKKIEKLWEMLELPNPVKIRIINTYEAFIKRLKAEILKLRTYPIPEHWCSSLMRNKLTHIIKEEFVFYVCAELDQDIIPLSVSGRDLLPGGLTRNEYKKRLCRVEKEFEIEEYEKKEAWGRRNIAAIGKIIKWLADITEEIEQRIEFAFAELPLLHRDGRTLEYLVNKNEDDKLLKELWDTLLRSIRHFYYNRIDIPSVAISYSNNSITCVAPPKEERNLPVASGVDRGATDGYQLVTPGSVLVEDNTVVVADRCGHLVSWYRREDLESLGCFHLESAETPVSMTLLFDALYVCYSDKLVQYNLTQTSTSHIQMMDLYISIEILGISCVTSTTNKLYVGTLKPSLILIGLPLLHIDKEYALNPIRYRNKNKFPWLQDMKHLSGSLLCLFTGSPYPLQMFSMTGFILLTVITAEQLSGSYHFDLFFNSVKNDWHIYVTDFWENVVKVFDLEGHLVDTYCQKGSDLCQLIHPTGVFVESSGYINICDMKEDNCVQRL